MQEPDDPGRRLPRPDLPRAVVLHRHEGRWQFAFATRQTRTLIAVLIDAELAADDAQDAVLHELALSYPVKLKGSWFPSDRYGAWRATLERVQAR